MKIVEFYRGERGNNVGAKLDDIMGWYHGWLEMDHDWVQWVFPSNEPSSLNGEAPVLTITEARIFQADPELREKMKASMILFLDFLGFRLAQDDEQGIVIEAIEPTKKRPDPTFWMNSFNHTMLRVTRMLKSLRLTGLTEYAVCFYNVLRTYRTKFSSNTFDYWTKAIMDPLWSHEVLREEHEAGFVCHDPSGVGLGNAG